MQYRRLGKADLRVSIIGFGCNRIADPSRERGEVLATLHEALERGVNYFDTADTYSSGESERLLGEALRGRRDQVTLCSKAGKRRGRPERIKKLLRPYVQRLRDRSSTGTNVVKVLSRFRPAQSFDAAYIVQAVERSLRRLRTNYLDVFLFHNPSPEAVCDGQLFEVAVRLKARGLIRYYGVACGSELVESQETLDKLLEDSNLIALQMRVNVSTTTTIERILPRVGSRGVAVLAFEPLGKGSILTDAKIRGALNRGSARTAAELALKFVLAQAEVSSVLVGMTKRYHLAENLAALDTSELTAIELAELSGTPANK